MHSRVAVSSVGECNYSASLFREQIDCRQKEQLALDTHRSLDVFFFGMLRVFDSSDGNLKRHTSRTYSCQVLGREAETFTILSIVATQTRTRLALFCTQTKKALFTLTRLQQRSF